MAIENGPVQGTERCVQKRYLRIKGVIQLIVMPLCGSLWLDAKGFMHPHSVPSDVSVSRRGGASVPFSSTPERQEGRGQREKDEYALFSLDNREIQGMIEMKRQGNNNRGRGRVGGRNGLQSGLFCPSPTRPIDLSLEKNDGATARDEPDAGAALWQARRKQV